VEVARLYDDAFNTKDAERRIASLTVNAELVLPGAMTVSGPEQITALAQSFWEALPDAKITSDHQVASGDEVVTEGRLIGTHTGTFRSPQREIPASGNRVELPYVSLKWIRDGKLAVEHLYFDQLTLLQQIGALPAAQAD
jgi:predicted ester cyclase